MKQLTNLDLSKNELQNAVLQPLATAPSSPKLGQMYYDTTDKVIKSWNGTAWEASSGGAGAWSELTGKPFSTIGDGLSVVDDALVADGIPTITIAISQVIGQNPVKAQLTNEQAEIVESNYVVHLNIEQLGKGTITLIKSDGGGEAMLFGFSGVLGGTYSHPFFYDEENKQITYYGGQYLVTSEDLNDRLDQYLSLGGGDMTGDIGMGNHVIREMADGTDSTDGATYGQVTGALIEAKDYTDTALADYVKKDGTVAMTGALAMGTHKITGLSNGTNSTDAVTLGQMGDAISAVEAKQLYATAAQGSFATKAALTGATTFYNADGTVATPTKNDVAYVLADESHDGKSAKYVVASTSPIVWGFVIAFSDVTFTQAQMNTINSGLTAADKTKLDGLTAVKTATGTLTAGTTSKSVSYTGTVIGTIVKDASGNEVIVDVAIAASSVTFTVAQAAAAALTCIVIYL